MTDLDILIAKDRIAACIHQLFISTDERDWPGVRACFADSVHFDMTSLAGGSPVDLTPGQITDMWDAGLKPLQHVHHQAGNLQITVQGQTAQAFCYGIALHYPRHPKRRQCPALRRELRFRSRSHLAGMGDFVFSLQREICRRESRTAQYTLTWASLPFLYFFLVIMNNSRMLIDIRTPLERGDPVMVGEIRKKEKKGYITDALARWGEKLVDHPGK